MVQLLFDTSPCRTDAINYKWLREYDVKVSVLRLDLIHPLISGNKLFKLHYFLEQTKTTPALLTFGGAYSNHLLATAAMANTLGLRATGIVRGEEPAKWSPTLIHCKALGMRLVFVSREAYPAWQSPGRESLLQEKYGKAIIIPEGGYHPLGAKGASLIHQCIAEEEFTHIATATGTATTLAGLIMGEHTQRRIVSYPVLKGLTDLPERLCYLTGDKTAAQNIDISSDHHFGGYAKYNQELLNFMNDCYNISGVPLDFVYTGKMLYGVCADIRQKKYPPGSHILCLHTGGLQGNLSLPPGRLHYTV